MKKSTPSVSIKSRYLKKKALTGRKQSKKPDNLLPKPFPIVAFGASAGGLEAFTSVLKYLDPNLGMAYVLIMHLSPDHKSSLTEILQSKTSMPVHTVKDGMELRVNNVFIIPPNTFMTVVDGHLKLGPRSLAAVGNYAIDYFLTTLAPLYKNNAIGVILSGTASDGTLGLKAVKAAGGITFAQNDSAGFAGMPESATKAGYVDFVLSPEGIARELASLRKIQYTVLPADTIEATQIKEINEHREELKKILTIVKIQSGIDFFQHYKQASIYRRVVRRMALNKFENLVDYYAMLRKSPREVDALYDDFLINVTHFFRDKEFFRSLEKDVFPALIKNNEVDDTIRIWVAGCASGEEAYSIAICLLEFLAKRKLGGTPIKIFASDLDVNAIEQARAGIYPVGSLLGISDAYLKQYFRKIDGNFQIVKSVRELCVFSQHNLLKDPPFSRINLISCQNVLIYLETAPQKKILQAFHYSLKPTGFLFLGKSETIGSTHDLFHPLNKKVKLFSRKAIKSPPLDFTMSRAGSVAVKEIRASELGEGDLDKDVRETMLSQFVHPAVVVNKKLTITQFFGITLPYLAPVSGKASFDILKMVRDDLVVDLRSLFQEARQTGKAASKSNIKTYYKKVLHEITLEVIPKKSLGEVFFLVVFIETANVPMTLPASRGKSKRGDGVKKEIVQKLEDELTKSREIIRTATEEYETTYEELQANNEEILSANEELQSVNEELETSKEELQSANEELVISNEEAQRRNIELDASQDYAEAIIGTIHSPLLVLNHQFQVRMANHAFYAAFGQTRESTEGVMLFELQNDAWDIPILRDRLREMAVKNSNFSEFELRHTFPTIGNRVLIMHIYRFLKNETSSKEAVILLSIEDITQQLTSNASLIKLQEQLKLSMMGDSIGTWSWTIATGEVSWSKETEMLNGISAGSFKGQYKDWLKLLDPMDAPSFEASIKKSIDNHEGVELEYRIKLPDNSERWILSRGQIIYNEYDKAERMVGVSIEYTEKKLSAETLKEKVSVSTSELLKRNKELLYLNEQLEQFAFISSHDLQEPLRKIMTFAGFLTEPEAELNPYAKKYSEKINKSARRMSLLVKDLLAFLSLIKRAPTFKKVDLNVVVADVISEFKDEIARRKVVVNIAELPFLYGDEKQLTQLFQNLVSNSLKYTTEDPVITISSKELSPEDFSLHPQLITSARHVAISVGDNGIGFNENYASKMFSLFQKVGDMDNTTGSGVGLAICKKIVETHGGFIFAHGEKNVGSIFIMFLPVWSEMKAS